MKKTTIDRLAHKYALNIKEIRGPAPTKIADFKNLNKNFYDDIESNNITLRDSRKLLNKIKDYSIKEFIYSNKEIPFIWKNKLNYQEDLLHTISRDKKLLSYLGSSTLKTRKYSLDKFPKINTRYDPSKSLRSRNISNKELKSMNEIADPNKSSIMNLSSSKVVKNKYSFKHNDKLTEKEINTLLDDYKMAYPIKEKLNELYITSNYYNRNKYKNNSMFSDLNNINNISNLNDTMEENKLINTKNAYNSIVTTSQRNPRHTYIHINRKLLSKKQKTFRQNIFNNLGPMGDTTFFSLNKSILDKTNKSCRLINIKNIYNGNKSEKELEKINDIKSPLIRKNIESINYYGPYFSFCPSCRNKNMDFFNNMAPKQCLELVQHIKKLRHKNPIINIRRTISVSPNKKSTSLQKETLESENEANSKYDLSEKEKVGNLI